MCFGYYKDNRPHIEAVVISPEVANPISVEFMIDTGSDITAISLIDALKLGVNISEITSREETQLVGVSGTTNMHPIYNVFLIFKDYSEVLDKFSYHGEFLEKIYLVPTLPQSVLGRDVLDSLI